MPPYNSSLSSKSTTNTNEHEKSHLNTTKNLPHVQPNREKYLRQKLCNFINVYYPRRFSGITYATFV